jgi:glucose-1-phosphate cytidylyltransferase
MKCVILCGGRGVRLNELTGEIPKPLINVGEKPIVEHIMDHYASHGIKDFVLCLGYLGEKIKDYFENKNIGYGIEMVDTGVDTSKAHRLLKVKHLLGESFFVSYGDDLSNVNITKLIDFHNRERKIATLTAVRLQNPYGEIALDDYEPHVVSDFIEKPIMNAWINGGYFIFDKNIFDYIDENDELEDHVFKKLTKEKQLSAFRHSGFWKSMNTLKDSIELNDMLKSGNLFKEFGAT